MPRLVHVSVYASDPDDASTGVPSPDSQPTFIFSSIIAPFQFSRSWSHTELLDRLLPKIEGVRCMSLSQNRSKPTNSPDGDREGRSSVLIQLLTFVAFGERIIKHWKA
ncbi:unnamed protein product [Dibothriocephalus latus]|uniref:Uncharacterized protein n=1 Tax=Dibothriocephalus latus TaxID=60516 RepID=A0A3P7P5J1_DIBLA|nr:unnamed protein product [Dibothriocephalus latus]